MKKWLDPPVTFLHILALLGIVLLPFPFYLIDYQMKLPPWLFNKFFRWEYGSAPPHFDFSSDAPGLFWWTGIVSGIAFALTLLLLVIPFFRKRRTTLLVICRLTSVYYLALQLLKYGFDKVFKAQFYLPEPNTLYTPVGQLDRDILFWTTMGTSWSYNVFMGLLEVIPALFLLFRPTRVLGLLASGAVLLNVVMINFSFGITVRLFSCFLLFLTLLLMLPFYRPLVRFFAGKPKITLPSDIWNLSFNIPPHIKTGLKTMVVGLMVVEANYPYLQSGIWNDDRAPRPPMHGAYEVIAMADSTHADFQPKVFPVKRFFIHRRGYLIFQDQQDKMQDFKLTVNYQQRIFELTDYQSNTYKIPFLYNDWDSTLRLQFPDSSSVYFLTGKRLPYRDLPAIR